MDENMAIDNFYEQKLNKWLADQDYKQPVEDYQGETIDVAKQRVYQLEGNSSSKIFAENDAVQFFDWLRNQYHDNKEMLEDYGLTVSDVKEAIDNGYFNEDDAMDFLMFLGAEELEVKD